MKDKLSRAVWWNQPIYNPTQIRYRRFVRTPGGGLPDMFGKSEDRLKELKDMMKSRFKMSEEPNDRPDKS